MNRIQFPQRTYADFSQPLTELIRIAGLIGLSKQGCSLDLTHSKFLSPFLLCGTAALLKHQQEQGLPSHGQVNCLSPDLKNYLDLIRFPQGLSHTEDTYSAKRLLAELRNKTYTPLVSFPANLAPNMDREDLIQAVESLLVHQCQMDGVMLTVIKYLVSELTGNVMYHAGFGTGFLLAQFMRNGKYLDLAIADTGRGLLGSYMAHGKFNPGSDAEALNLALNGRSTKDLPESRGFGIPTSRRMLVNGLGGSFFYWSGSACLFNSATHDNIYELKDGTSFPGCYIALRIPTVTPSSFQFYDFIG